MSPHYRHGQIVVVSVFRNFSVGDVVVAVINRREVIKRVDKMKDGRVFLLGDNEDHSTDSRAYGWITDDKILGRVVYPRRQARK